MIRVVLEDGEICIPAWVVDLESFRRWSEDDAIPETARVSLLLGEVCIDLSREQLFSHNQVRSEISTVLRNFVKAHRPGRFFAAGVFLSNVDAASSNQPDGVFVSAESLREGRVRIVEGRTEGHVELEGSPDMVLEVVSRSSVEKDTVVLRQAYATAGIREYWLVDARSQPLQFDLLRLDDGRYRSTRKRLGWVRSEVFGCWLRLTQEAGADGFPEFTLALSNEKPT